MYKYKNKAFTFTPGLRFESINLKRYDYESNSTRDESNLLTREKRSFNFNSGVGMNYTFSMNFCF